jgi:hypothetical protein
MPRILHRDGKLAADSVTMAAGSGLGALTTRVTFVTVALGAFTFGLS